MHALLLPALVAPLLVPPVPSPELEPAPALAPAAQDAGPPVVAVPAAGGQDTGPAPAGAAEAAAALEAAFRAAGVRVDAAAGALAFPASVQVRDELLEYLLVNPNGAVHESLFVTGVGAEVLNAALLTLGVERGENVRYVEKDPPPTEAELRAGARAFEVVPPRGDGVHLYATWKEGEDTFFYRVEDLVRDLERGRTMRRHAWVYLGSRWLESRRNGGQPVYAAAAEGNLACIAFFTQGNTLLTAALPECVAQSSWLPNGWLLPRVGADVLLVAARGPLVAAPATFADAVPTVAPEAEGGGSTGGDGR